MAVKLTSWNCKHIWPVKSVCCKFVSSPWSFFVSGNIFKIVLKNKSYHDNPHRNKSGILQWEISFHMLSKMAINTNLLLSCFYCRIIVFCLWGLPLHNLFFKNMVLSALLMHLKCTVRSKTVLCLGTDQCDITGEMLLQFNG